jgi:hypothetical protein
MLGPLDGAKVPGGCDSCNAYQTVGQLDAGLWKITVHHDDDCPTFAQIDSNRRRHGKQRRSR